MADGNYFELPVDRQEQPLCFEPSASHTRTPSSNNPWQKSGRSESRDERAVHMNNSPTPQLSSTFSEFTISNDITHRASPASRHTEKRGTENTKGAVSAQFAKTSSDPRSARLDVMPSLQQITPHTFQTLYSASSPETLVLLDMRTFAKFQVARVHGSMNISMPATLLKRNTYTIAKIAEGLQSADDEKRLKDWQKSKAIFIYDSDSFNVGAGTALHQFATKFSGSGFRGHIYTIVGGFAAIARDAGSTVDRTMLEPKAGKAPIGRSSSKLSLSALGSLSCVLPNQGTVVNPFFNNIRQNQDLIGGVGEPIPLQVPPCSDEIRDQLPIWLRTLAFNAGGPKIISDRFLKIEQEEQQRMQRVLNAANSIKSDFAQERHSIAAGLERGDKNRYNNIWPFEHSRVRLQDLAKTSSEYINANYLHIRDSGQTYIATQGPLPGTTKDFWQMVWENDVQVVVMLTKTVEGGQNKCHPYWEDCERMMPYQVEVQEHARNDVTSNTEMEEVLTIRKLILVDSSKPLAPAREITHFQFTDWPDLHIIKPDAILSLITEVHAVQSSSHAPLVKRRKSVGTMTQAGQSTWPILSHCSAGCGRTGVFCTIDTVLALVRKQLDQADNAPDSSLDLIEHVVRGYRDQRISIVQTLRQFVLCYDAVLLYSIDYLRTRPNPNATTRQAR